MGSVLSLAALAFLTAIAFMPWQSGNTALMAALLPVAGLHYWALRRPQLIPGVAVLFCGLTADIVSGGPFGFWACLYALAWLIGLMQRPWAERGWKIGRWGLFAVTIMIVALFAYGLGHIVRRPLGSAADIAMAAGWLILIYPVLALFLRILDVDRGQDELEARSF
jgi:hypothetical protein